MTCPLDPGYVKVRGDGLECLSPSSNTGKPEISGEGELVGQGSVSGEREEKMKYLLLLSRLGHLNKLPDHLDMGSWQTKASMQTVESSLLKIRSLCLEMSFIQQDTECCLSSRRGWGLSD